MTENGEGRKGEGEGSETQKFVVLLLLQGNDTHEGKERARGVRVRYEKKNSTEYGVERFGRHNTRRRGGG